MRNSNQNGEATEGITNMDGSHDQGANRSSDETRHNERLMGLCWDVVP